MTEAEQLKRFHSALVAFEIRFEQDLTEPWDRLETKAYFEIVGSPITKKYQAFHRFFEDVPVELARVIHAHFPTLLELAIANRQFLEDQSPIAWTKSQVLRQVCDFAGIDEKLDESAEPRADSRIQSSAESLTRGWQRTDGRDVSGSLLLPRWTRPPHPVESLFPSSDARVRYEAELETEELPRAETLKWASREEFWLRRLIEHQLYREELDGVVEAGKSSVSTWPLSEAGDAPSQPPPTPTSEPSQDNKFVWAGGGWTIAFRAETCILAQMIGLDYISVLLQHPGQELDALRLQALAAGMTAPTPLLDDARTGRSYERDVPTHSEESFRDELIDKTTITQAKERMAWLQHEIAGRQERGDRDLEGLQKELTEIRQYLRASLNIRHRPRTFADANEKARQSITKALRRACSCIRKLAPQTADHFESLIRRGSEFSYMDSVTQWHVRRS